MHTDTYNTCMDVKKTSIPDFTRLDLFLLTANWLQASYLSIPPFAKLENN